MRVLRCLPPLLPLALTACVTGPYAQGHNPSTTTQSTTQTQTQSGTSDAQPVYANKTISLPAAGQPDAQLVVTTPSGDSGVTLSIPANSIVNAQGVVVTGEVSISVTYYSPSVDLAAIPGNMVGTPTGTEASPQSLVNFGAAQVTITQNGQACNVAPGAQLTETFKLPIANATTYQQYAAAEPSAVGLWQLDASTTLWTMSTPVTQSSQISYNSGTGCVQASVTSTGHCCGVCAKENPCALPTAAHLGQPCNATHPCCPMDGTLVCSDMLCVPAAD